MSVPSQIAQCGVEPTYYQYIGSSKVESIDHMSWENCIADWRARYGMSYLPDGTKIQERHYDVSDLPPVERPVADQLQSWLSMHTDLAVAVAVVGLFVIVIIVIMLFQRGKRA